ncbi:serine hydrolase domain-containing protein [Dongia rigui]|uniref:Serine hydrolase n=1 Tax=Dongia rigui TaxID=940149 RepID=A0ABU5E123_9PROT|nr:serine hydrolase [Dongia rigui]MDY0872900.1 serine hydrolase [Dongia rigui]
MAFDFSPADPAAHGFSGSFVAKLDKAIADGTLPNLHGLVILADGKLVLERYVAGVDESWGRPLGKVDFTADTIHDLRSVSKSIVALLYGIALKLGQVPAADASLIAQFPDYPDLAQDPQLAKRKIFHVLTMTLGQEWNEDLPYTDPRNSEIAMEMAPDRYRFILERPVLAEPGTGWTYSGGASALLGRFIEKGSGLSLVDFARQHLFVPLGIDAVEWIAGADGTYSAASGLRLRPRDLAKIGHCVIKGGMWDGGEVIPADWLAEAFTQRIICFDDIGYGYQWYLRASTDGNGPRRFAMGNGGQRLILIPERKLAIAILCGQYNHPDQWKTPAAIMLEHVLPGLTRG